MIKATGNTPPGTPPLPTRRATKHKRVSHGADLIARAQARRDARAENQARLKAVASSTEFAKLPKAEQESIKVRLAKRPTRPAKLTEGHRRAGVGWDGKPTARAA